MKLCVKLLSISFIIVTSPAVPAYAASEKAGSCPSSAAFIRIEEEGRANWGFLAKGHEKFFITPQKRAKFGWHCENGSNREFDCDDAPRQVLGSYSQNGEVRFDCQD